MEDATHCNRCKNRPEIHYTRIFKIYQRWVNDKSLERVFENTVGLLVTNNLTDLTVLHGDGSSTPAKKGGDMIGYNGHKHFKGEKVVAEFPGVFTMIIKQIVMPRKTSRERNR